MQRDSVYEYSFQHTQCAISTSDLMWIYQTNCIVVIACQARGGAPPANDLQSQLDDMLDDSASDNSSSVQMRGGPNSPLPPAAPAVGDRSKDRGLNPNLGARQPELQQMLSMLEDEAEIDLQDMAMLGPEANQQSSEMSNQLQVIFTTAYDAA